MEGKQVYGFSRDHPLCKEEEEERYETVYIYFFKSFICLPYLALYNAFHRFCGFST